MTTYSVHIECQVESLGHADLDALVTALAQQPGPVEVVLEANLGTCSPTGSPSVVQPAGTDAAGWPVRFAGRVNDNLPSRLLPSHTQGPERVAGQMVPPFQ